MRRVTSSLILTLLLVCCWITAAAAGSAPRCDFTKAVNSCDATKQSACDHWKCLHEQCHNDITLSAVRAACESQGSALDAPYAAVSPATQLLGDVERRQTTAGSDKKRHVREVPKLASPAVNSPCGAGDAHSSWPIDKIRSYLYKVAMDVYSQRANEVYSENMVQRWDGIAGHVCPSAVPHYSDCSSMVTWVYWTLFGNGPDFLNGENWKAGYTGSLIQHGVSIPSPSPSNLMIGDLCFYYHPMHHTAIYVGNGKVVSHGMDPVGYYAWDYAPVDYCRRYL